MTRKKPHSQLSRYVLLAVFIAALTLGGVLNNTARAQQIGGSTAPSSPTATVANHDSPTTQNFIPDWMRALGTDLIKLCFTGILVGD